MNIEDVLDWEMRLTNEDILLFGLTYGGFPRSRQKGVRPSYQVERFKSFYGVGPETVQDVLFALRDKFSTGLIYKDVMMTVNWLKICMFFIIYK